MCVIIDTNRIHVFFKKLEDEDSQPIRDWIEKKNGHIIYSTDSKFGEELDYKIVMMLGEYRQNKQATMIKGQSVAKEIQHLRRLKKRNSVSIESDDLHILALARVSGARLLYTADQNLKKDFKNKSIIDNPRGKVYSTAKNENLLRPDICKPKT